MMKKIIAVLSAFIISINCFNISAVTVYASGSGTRDLRGFDNWSVNDRFNYLFTHSLDFICGIVGCVLPYSDENIVDSYLRYQWDSKNISDMTYEEWVASRLHYDEEKNGLVCDDELADTMYQAITVMIKEGCGWYEMKTLDYRDVSATSFTTQGLYNAFVSYCTQNLKGTDNVIFAKNEVIESSGGATMYYIPTTEVLSGVEYYQNVISGNECLAYITQEWSTVSVSFKRLTESGLTETQHSTSNTTLMNTTGLYSLDGRGIPITDGSRTVRVYKSLEELKSYSVGQRPYFVTDKFLNYDISGDNSCILSESDLSNGSVYGDVYNYIMDNYDNPNNLTEDQLTIIVENYINGSGGGSVSGNGTGSSGNGLSDFLGGLGSVGDAILSILGKLLEYVGKALDLVSGTVTKVLDIVPKNITALLSALFPFFPEEWLLAIELGLVLSVIVGIVGIFKK